MKGDNLKKILLGIGIGLVFISIVLWAFYFGDGSFLAPRELFGAKPTVTDDNSTPNNISVTDTGVVDVHLLATNNVILLDGDESKLLSDSEVDSLINELLALDEEINAYVEKLTSPATTAEATTTTAATTTATTTTTPSTAATSTTSTATTATTTTVSTTAAPITTTTAAPTTTATTAATTTATATTTASTTTTTAPTTAAPTTTTTAPTTTASTTTATTTTATTTTATTTTTTTTTTAPTTTDPTTTTTAPATTDPTTTTTAPATAAPADSYASILIARGDTATIVANKLYNIGIIADTAEFLAKLSDMHLTGEIQEGTYEIPYGIDLDALIDLIRVHK